MSNPPDQCPHPDIAQLTVKVNNGPSMQVINVYSAPTGCVRAGEGVRQLQNMLDTAQPVLMLGDFNLRHEH